MKDYLSLFLFKNYLGAKMRKGFKHFCNDHGSTSTLNQQRMMGGGGRVVYSPDSDDGERDHAPPKPTTLEEMILQLEIEEAASRRAKLDEEYGGLEIRHRMSCVNSSDILRSARSALNQYPRFSLDGRDAMHRSSFRRNLSPVVGHGQQGSGRGFYANRASGSGLQRLREMPATVAGERVVWCSPGVVAKLMGLEAIPIPVQRYRRCRRDQHLGLNSSVIKRQNLMRRTIAGGLRDDHDRVEKTRSELDPNGRGGLKRGEVLGSCSSSRQPTQGYCFMKPLGSDLELRNEELGWQMRHSRRNDASRY